MCEGGNLLWDDADKLHYSRPRNVTVTREVYEFIRDTDTETLVLLKARNPSMPVSSPYVKLYY